MTTVGMFVRGGEGERRGEHDGVRGQCVCGGGEEGARKCFFSSIYMLVSPVFPCIFVVYIFHILGNVTAFRLASVLNMCFFFFLYFPIRCFCCTGFVAVSPFSYSGSSLGAGLNTIPRLFMLFHDPIHIPTLLLRLFSSSCGLLLSHFVLLLFLLPSLLHS